MTIFLVIFTAGVTWFLISVFIYDHKSRIKRLWKEVFRYSFKIGEWKKEHEFVASAVIPSLENRIKKAGNLINAILDYEYQDSENEEELEYAKENRWEGK